MVGLFVSPNFCCVAPEFLGVGEVGRPDDWGVGGHPAFIDYTLEKATMTISLWSAEQRLTPPADLSGVAILRLVDLVHLLGRSRSAIYAAMNPRSPYFDPNFPRRVRLSARAVGWRSQDVATYLHGLREVA